MDYPLEAVPEECRGMPMLTRAELKALELSIFEQYGMFRAMDSLTCRCLDGRGKNDRIPVGVDPNVPHSYWCLMPKNAHEIMINERVFETRESCLKCIFNWPGKSRKRRSPEVRCVRTTIPTTDFIHYRELYRSERHSS